MDGTSLNVVPMVVDDKEGNDDDLQFSATSSLAPTTLLRDQALGLISDAQTAERKDKEVLLKQVRIKNLSCCHTCCDINMQSCKHRARGGMHMMLPVPRVALSLM